MKEKLNEKFMMGYDKDNAFGRAGNLNLMIKFYCIGITGKINKKGNYKLT